LDYSLLRVQYIFLKLLLTGRGSWFNWNSSRLLFILSSAGASCAGMRAIRKKGVPGIIIIPWERP
ncbi:MAG: hypothetical protein QNK14_00225, partial [Desulfobacterales bacterium]|nr:hypothetical protein [Desulfobacterales bacterium]